MASKSTMTRMAAFFVVLMIMSSTLSSSSCYARTIQDGVNPPVCFHVEKCQDRCQTACSLSGKPSTGA
ncbi:hypothetical protein CFC21_042815 [Triticum aestivum]|uniref:Plant thionin family protein n=2 Tax=Triticum aestivum TaxID=4565 RepID=A0A3B6FVT8_WHEAT|nr:hypothetical protein CFC21_042815 [Triticum aestivum]